VRKRLEEELMIIHCQQALTTTLEDGVTMEEKANERSDGCGDHAAGGASGSVRGGADGLEAAVWGLVVCKKAQVRRSENIP